jgi:hypothetical protein
MYEILSKIHNMVTRDTVRLCDVTCFTLPGTNPEATPLMKF